MKVLVFLVALIASSAHINADISVTVNLRSSVNEISDKFISTQIDFYKLMDVVRQQRNVTILSPSYVKLDNFLKYLRDDDNEKREGEVVAIFQSLHRNKITPVIVLDYNVESFDPLTLLKDLKRANEFGIKECIWQLGDPSSLQLSDNSSQKKYTDDLRTLRILCEGVKRGSKSNWNVTAVGDCISSSERTATSVEGLDSGVFSQSEILSSSSGIKAPSSIATRWATINSLKLSSPHQSSGKGQGSCHENCLINGLLYANVLGEAAKKGFDVLFFDDEVASSQGTDDLKHAINKVHNALIGTKVFNARMLKKFDKHQSSVYAYCAKKMNGGVTLMGINYSNTRAKINSKLLSSSIESNSVVSQYLLSVADGYVMLNNERYNGTINPAYKFKKILKHSLDFTIPPFSIMFWVIKSANVKECANIESNHVRTLDAPTSSSDKLLKTLAAKAIVPSSRTKRQFTPFLPKLDLKMPNFDFLPSNINQRSIKDVLFSRNTEIYKVAPVAEHNPLESSENPSLPNGDIYLLVNDGEKDEYVDAEIEYPQIQRKAIRKPVPKRIYDSSKKSRDSVNMPSETHEYVLSHDYVENPYTTAETKKSPASKKPSKPQEIGELFELEKPTLDYEHDQQMRSTDKNVEIKTVMRELEPTVRQSKKAILAAKKKWNQEQIMELLKDATLEEVDRSQIRNAEDLEVIDLTENDELPDYAEYDDDEDGFFSNSKVRTRRFVSDFKRNEIPREGDHYIDLDGDEDFSIESIDSSHFLPPRYGHDNSKTVKLMTSSTDKVTTTTEAPTKDSLGVKFVDVMGKSLDDVVHTIHKSVHAFWKIFDQEFA